MEVSEWAAREEEELGEGGPRDGLRDSLRFIALLPVPTCTAVPSAPIKSS